MSSDALSLNGLYGDGNELSLNGLFFAIVGKIQGELIMTFTELNELEAIITRVV